MSEKSTAALRRENELMSERPDLSQGFADACSRLFPGLTMTDSERGIALALFCEGWANGLAQVVAVIDLARGSGGRA